MTFTYQGGSKPAVRNINLNVMKGETVVIMGPAGAGKSTVCRLLNGLVPHFFRGEMDGRVLITGLDTTDFSIGYLSHLVGLLFDDPTSQLICPSVLDEISFGLENYGIPQEEMMKRVKYYIKACRLEGYEGRNPHTLSGGEQQACALAAIMAMQPKIYALDEPTSRLDPIGSYQVYSMIKELSKTKEHTLIIADNKIEELVDIADRLILMNKGKIVLEGEPKEVLKHTDKIIEAGVKPPQVTELFHLLKKNGYNFESTPTNLKEAYDLLSKILRPRKNNPKTTKKRQCKPASGKSVIETINLWHTYPDGTTALRDINLKFFEGEFVAIIGQNGSGKTTLVKHFNALLKPTQGRVHVYGVDTTTTTPSELARRVGFVFQNPDHQLFARTVREELEFGPKNYKVPPEEVEKRIKESLEAVRLEWNILEAKPMSLSTAQKQRVNIASVLMLKPSVLIVDEPTTGQDPLMRREIMELMKRQNEEGITVIVITHDMNLVAEYVDRGIVLKHGEVLYDGSTKEVFSRPEMLAETFLKPPQITVLGQMLKNYGVPSDILTVDDMYGYLTKNLG